MLNNDIDIDKESNDIDVDKENREITVLESNGWMFQFDNHISVVYTFRCRQNLLMIPDKSTPTILDCKHLVFFIVQIVNMKLLSQFLVVLVMFSLNVNYEFNCNDFLD